MCITLEFTTSGFGARGDVIIMFCSLKSQATQIVQLDWTANQRVVESIPVLGSYVLYGKNCALSLFHVKNWSAICKEWVNSIMTTKDTVRITGRYYVTEMLLKKH